MWLDEDIARLDWEAWQQKRSLDCMNCGKVYPDPGRLDPIRHYCSEGCAIDDNMSEDE